MVFFVLGGEGIGKLGLKIRQLLAGPVVRVVQVLELLAGVLVVALDLREGDGRTEWAGAVSEEADLPGLKSVTCALLLDGVDEEFGDAEV